MAAALHKRQVIGVLDRLGEFPNRLGQQVRVVGHFDRLGDFRFGLLRGVQNVRLAFSERPLETLLGSVNVEALAILARRVVQESPDMSRDVTVGDFDLARGH